jgi:putative transposase
MGTHWKNFYLDNHVHHVTCTVHKWQKALLFSGILSFLYDEINYKAIKWNISVIGYVIMPEHFHLMLHSFKGENVMKADQAIRRSISGQARKLIESKNIEFCSFALLNGVDINQFYKGTCSKSEFRFWKEKPRVFPLNFEDEIQKKLDYIHMNPVRRGLVDDPLKWEHSSIRAHLISEISRIPIGFRNFDKVILERQDVGPRDLHPDAYRKNG